jgi:hypothetical protein
VTRIDPGATATPVHWSFILGCDVQFSDRTVTYAGRTAFAVLGIFALFPIQADQVYRSVDAQGRVTYSDRPTAAGAQKTDITVQQANPQEAQRLAKEQMLLKAEDDQRSKKEAEDSQLKAKQDGDKKRKCEYARDHYNTLKDARRLYAPTSDGNKEYYTDAQADAMRNEAKRAMDAACGS